MARLNQASTIRKYTLTKCLLGLLIILGLSACGGGDPEFNDQPVETDPTPGQQESSAAASEPGGDPTPPPDNSGQSSSVASSSSVAEPDFDVQSASHIYTTQCASCHGNKGTGGLGGDLKTCTTCDHTDLLTRRIADTMPLTDPASCGDQCAGLLAQYIQSGFPEPDTGTGNSSSAGASSSSGSSSSSIVIPPASSSSESASSAQSPSSSAAASASSADAQNSSSSTGAESSSSNNGGASSSGETGSSSSAEGSSSSAEGSSSSSQGASSSSSEANEGDPVLGQSRYTNNCASCHGEKGEGFFHLDASKSEYQYSSGNSPQPLASYIEDWMPEGGASACVGDCARNVAAYIRTWEGASSSSAASSSANSSSNSAVSSSTASSSSVAASSSSASSTGGSSSSANSSSSSSEPSTDIPGSCDVAYGPRAIRVLTQQEYVNSVRDLTGVDILADLGRSVYDALPADNKVNGFSNNVMASIESGSLQSYSLVASRIADFLAERDFEGVIDCSEMEAEQCGMTLIDDFAFRVFRRPLTETERIDFQEMFTTEYTGGDVKEGLKLAIRTLLTSPNFLYRSETGLSMDEIENGQGDDPQYEPAGEVTTLIDSDEPSTLSIYNQNGQGINYSGDNLLEIVVRGTQSSRGLWPSMRIATNDDVIAQVLVDHSYNKTYRFRVEDLNGQHYTAIINQQVGADFEHEGGHDLIVSGFRVSGVRLVEPDVPDAPLDPDTYVLTPYELASFLSFTFAGTTPDLELLETARRGELSTRAQIEAQVERLLDTPQARKQFGNLAAQWLRTDRVLEQIKDPDLYPGFTTEVREAMAQEVREIFNHVVLDEGESFSTLYDGDFTFVNNALADFYGISGVSGDQLQKVSGVGSRAGLVTAGAFLTVNAHEQETAPILRSVYARRAFLCHNVPAPPTGISLSGEDVDAVREEQRLAWEAYLEENNGLATSRKKYEFQTSAPLCQTCHEEMINPLGAGFEDFDAVGLPQTVDYNNLIVEFDGELNGVTQVNDGQQITFEGAKEFAHAIAELDVTRQCFIDNVFRLAMGTGAKHFDYAIPSITLSEDERTSYSCEANRLDQVMSESDFSTRELLKAIGSMDSVRYRKNVTR